MAQFLKKRNSELSSPDWINMNICEKELDLLIKKYITVSYIFGYEAQSVSFHSYFNNIT